MFSLLCKGRISICPATWAFHTSHAQNYAAQPFPVAFQGVGALVYDESGGTGDTAQGWESFQFSPTDMHSNAVPLSLFLLSSVGFHPLKVDIDGMKSLKSISKYTEDSK